VRLAATLYDIYDKNTYVDRIGELLDDLEGRQNDPKRSDEVPAASCGRGVSGAFR
jgi:hypothetical protein